MISEPTGDMPLEKEGRIRPEIHLKWRKCKNWCHVVGHHFRRGKGPAFPLEGHVEVRRKPATTAHPRPHTGHAAPDLPTTCSQLGTVPSGPSTINRVLLDKKIRL